MSFQFIHEFKQQSCFQKTTFSPATLHISSRPTPQLVEYITRAEQLLIDHSDILPAALNWTRFTLDHARRTQDGMIWSNMGIKFWELPMVPIIRNFPHVLKIMRPILAPQYNFRVKRQLKSASGMVCVSMPGGDLSNAVNAGRLMMTAWLSLTQQGYAAQPITISSTIALCAIHGLVELPQKWIEFFHEGRDILRKEFSIPIGMDPVWILRTGLAKQIPKKTRTLRRSISEVLRFRR